MKRVFLLLGLVLLICGSFGAVASTVAMGMGAALTSQALQQLLVVEVVSTAVAMIGLVVTILTIVLRRNTAVPIQPKSKS
jgi:hypothetical protein